MQEIVLPGDFAEVVPVFPPVFRLVLKLLGEGAFSTLFVAAALDEVGAGDFADPPPPLEWKTEKDEMTDCDTDRERTERESEKASNSFALTCQQ